MLSVDAKLAGYPSDRAGAVYREILRRLRALPGVKSASASVVRPVDDQFHLRDKVNEIDGRTLPGPQCHPRRLECHQPRLFLHCLDAGPLGKGLRPARRRKRAQGGHCQRVPCQPRFPEPEPDRPPPGFGHHRGCGEGLAVRRRARPPQAPALSPTIPGRPGSGVPLGVRLLRTALRLALQPAAGSAPRGGFRGPQPARFPRQDPGRAIRTSR